MSTIVGMRGCGKSTLTQRLADSHNRKIIFDFVREWSGNFRYAKNFEEFSNHFRECFHESKYTIIIQFEFGTPQEEIIETQTKIVSLVYRTGHDSELETCIIFEEAQFYFPNHGLHPVNLHLLTTGRHAFINVIANSQRPASINKLLISQSKDVYIGQLFESNDIKYLYDSVGDIAFEAKNLKQFEFIYYPVGNPEGIQVIAL